MKFRHPSKEKLAAWLNGQIDDERDDRSVESHMAGCGRCSTVVEALAGESGSSQIGTPSLSTALRSVLDGPPDLPERLEARVTAQLGSRELMGIMAELFGAGLETGRLLIVDPSPGEEP